MQRYIYVRRAVSPLITLIVVASTVVVGIELIGFWPTLLIYTVIALWLTTVVRRARRRAPGSDLPTARGDRGER